MTPLDRLWPVGALPAHPNVPGLALTWTPTTDSSAFWSAFDREISAPLREAHERGTVRAVLPYEHRAVCVAGHGGTTWSIAVVVIGRPGGALGELAHMLEERAKSSPMAARGSLRSLDIVAMQPNLDLLSPGRPRMQWLEYVVSKPATRELYYAQQYAFSGPAMKRLNASGGCERFIGFEVVERRYAERDVAPWDVLHISGFGLWQQLWMFPRFLSAAQLQAKEVLPPGTTARDVFAAWEQMRTKTMVRARQRDAQSLAFR